MNLLRRFALLAPLLVLLAGCASPVKTAVPPGAQVWAGRMALSVEGSRNQSFSAGFELKGAPQAGELTLFNPLGGTVGVLAWAPGSATLRSGNDVRQFASLDELSTEVTGAAIPVTALFDWLGGKPTVPPSGLNRVSSPACGAPLSSKPAEKDWLRLPSTLSAMRPAHTWVPGGKAVFTGAAQPASSKAARQIPA